MTRSNLDEHLAWLLGSRLSIPPATSPFPQASLSFTSAEASLPNSEEDSTIQPRGQGVAEVHQHICPQGRSLIDAPQSVRSPVQSNMARLRTAPGSAGKPTLLSTGPGLSSNTPQNRTINSAPMQPSVCKSPAQPPLSARTPTVQHPHRPLTPSDVEIMDLTENMDQLRSPSGGRGRKRKSSELEPDVAGARHSRLARTHPRGQAAYEPLSASQQSFTAIDEIMDEPLEPPPPYSTIAPRLPSPPRDNARSRESSSILAGAGSHQMLDLQEDDNDKIVNFTGTPSKRSRPTASTPSGLLTEPSLAAVPVHSLSRSETRNANEQEPSRAVTPLHPLAGAQQIAPAPSPMPSSTFQSVQTSENLLLKQFLDLSEAEVKSLAEQLDSNHERLVNAIFELIEADEDDADLQSDLERSNERRGALAMLSEKEKEFQRLTEEKSRAATALKHAIRVGEGVDAAKAANTTCKTNLQKAETESLSYLRICQKDVESYLQSTSRSGWDGAFRNNAVRSTQASYLPQRPSEAIVPSSSRIAQTQMIKCAMPPERLSEEREAYEDEISPSNIQAYFSPSKKRTVDRSAVIESFQPSHKSTVKKNPLGDHLDDSEKNVFDARQDLFSNRMGTPPAYLADEEDDDFGIGDDDGMLELAENIENYGMPPSASNQRSNRPVFAELPSNSQRKASNFSARKTKKAQAETKESDMDKLFRFAWSDDVKSTLKERFQLRGFRHNQLEAINATLSGKDTFVLMPTGGGKSLCYQLPSLITSGRTLGVTVVVSPLLSLMEDQVQHLRRLNIDAFLINGETKAAEKRDIFDKLDERAVEKSIQLLYITPEMLNKSGNLISTFERLYKRSRLARLVIDEAHCVSQWGHDFRPDYKQIGDVRRKFPTVPVMALTATATENVKVDTIHNLSIDGCAVYTQSFNRPNLFYEIRKKAGGNEDIQNIADLINEWHNKQTGIIYCLSKKNCEDIAEALRDQHRIKARHYHAGIDPKEKVEVQKEWQAGKCHVIVATIAFGMGIDKPNVRFVIHHTIPKSLEGYYQETGRAGRDQMKSSCYLFYSYKDAGKIRRMIDDGEGDWQQKERQHLMLRKMVQYCENGSDCRRVQVLRYFSETFHRDECEGQCDNCNSTSTFETVDFTLFAQQAINIVRQIHEERFTVQHCIGIFCASGSKRIKDKKHNELAEYGAGKDLDRSDVERLFSTLLSEQAIVEENVVNKSGFATQYVGLGPMCRKYNSGKATFQMQISTTPRAKPKAAPKKKRTKKTDPGEEQSRKWKKTVGSKAPAELPMSTNVSSPVQAASSRKQARKPARGRTYGDSHPRDGFVPSDAEDGNYVEEEGDSSEAAFEPIRIAGQQRVERLRNVGPPIRSDRVMEDLDDIHRMLVESFVEGARKKAKQISIDKNLSSVPFTDTILRQMAINFTESKEQMLDIPGINEDRVQLYGGQFCKLVRDCRRSYNEMMADRPDPNAQNVIDLVSDEESEYGSLGPSDFEDEDDEGEPSAYFRQTQAADDFSARFAASQSPAARGGVASRTAKKGQANGKKRNYRPTVSAGTATRRRSTGRSRDTSNSRYVYGPQSEATKKKKNSGNRASGGGNRGSNFAARGRYTRGGRGGGGISMMPA